MTECLFDLPITVTIHYSDTEIIGIDEDSLILNYWDEDSAGWIDAVDTCEPSLEYDRHPEENWLSLQICHLSQFAMFGPEIIYDQKIYLPLIMNGQQGSSLIKQKGISKFDELHRLEKNPELDKLNPFDLDVIRDEKETNR